MPSVGQSENQSEIEMITNKFIISFKLHDGKRHTSRYVRKQFTTDPLLDGLVLSQYLICNMVRDQYEASWMGYIREKIRIIFMKKFMWFWQCPFNHRETDVTIILFFFIEYIFRQWFFINSWEVYQKKFHLQIFF